MCGIAAVLLFPQERTALQWRAIRNSFSQNLLFNEERGMAATGVAVANADGQVVVYKQPQRASRFIKTPGYRDILSKINSKTTLILGHTRLPTKGSPAKNENNHPIRAGDVFGVHNGHIENDDELFAQCGCQRDADVDSEIIFRLIENNAPSMKSDQYLKKVRAALQPMEGQYTFLACNQNSPEYLLALKHKNQLCIYFHREWNALIFSSRYIFLRKTFGPSLFGVGMESDRLMLFNAYQIPSLGTMPIASMSIQAEGVRP